MKEFKESIQTDPTRYIIAGLLIILVFFGGLSAWAVYFPFQGAVIATGAVKVFGERKIVQHLEGGIIDRIFVKEGDQVEQGDVLIELKSSRVLSDVKLLEGRLMSRLAEEARLNAEIAMKEEINWPKNLTALKDQSEIADIITTETNIFQHKRSDMEGKISLYNSQIKQLGNKIEGAREEYRTQDELIANLNEELSAKRPLVKDKYMGKTEVLELERTLAQVKGRKAKLTQDIAEYEQMIQGLRLNIIDLQNQYRERAVSSLAEAKDAIFQLQEQIKPHLDEKERLQVKAPISGEILSLMVNSEGSGVIQPGMALMEIVPTDSKLIIEVQVRPQDITNVSKGQKTKVQLSAFQRASIPPISGEVTYISSDLITQRTNMGNVSYYVAHVEVNQKDLEEKKAYLSPGMPVSCYITTDKRNVISYLLGPLLENVDHAMRE
jgi:epimerase transport system membrane fusion protein